ncbi:MAG: MerR family transcriptional regulator [Spirochaetae bacterium HGW-Spirochaetae-7]|jgi:MerR family mercuric resistance operon transcriptional regulator|nr:MAG: MerR family transcriptional regulator [Spirochaetae bacterium HGW-Spirochaetae-7]
MDRNSGNLTISMVAEVSGVGVETIRYYQRRGLLREPPRIDGSIRRYGTSDIDRLRFIKAAKRLSFSLDEIAQLLRLEDGLHCDEAASIATARLEDVRSRLSDLQKIEQSLTGLLNACGARTATIRCPLIAALCDES